MSTGLSKTYRFKMGFGEAEVLALRAQVSEQMRQAGVGSDHAYALINVLDEFCCNMMEHSGASWVEIVVSPRDSGVSAHLRDDGEAFDPTAAIKNVSPDQPQNVIDRRLGLYMISLLAKDLTYHREGDVNHLEFSMRA